MIAIGTATINDNDMAIAIAQTKAIMAQLNVEPKILGATCCKYSK